MGYSISWMAVKDKSSEKILELLGLAETIEIEAYPSSKYNATQFPGDWYFVWFNRCESPYVKKDVLGLLSESCSVVVCVVEEHVMYSRAEFWENGVQVWQVIHDAQQGLYDLQVSGSIPESFDSLKSRIFSKQEEEGGESAGVDYIFDVPTELLRGITNFKHDEETEELKGVQYKVLKLNKSDKAISIKPWYQFW